MTAKRKDIKTHNHRKVIPSGDRGVAAVDKRGKPLSGVPALADIPSKITGVACPPATSGQDQPLAKAGERDIVSDMIADWLHRCGLRGMDKIITENDLYDLDGAIHALIKDAVVFGQASERERCVKIIEEQLELNDKEHYTKNNDHDYYVGRRGGMLIIRDIIKELK